MDNFNINPALLETFQQFISTQVRDSLWSIIEIWSVSFISIILFYYQKYNRDYRLTQ